MVVGMANNNETSVSQLHGEVLQEFSKGRCSELQKEEVLRCVEEVFRDLGFQIYDLCLVSLDGEPVRDIDFARYIRIEARHPQTGSMMHIFTLAVFRRKDRYNVIFLQSAIKP